jgi:hypothetical protein
VEEEEDKKLRRAYQISLRVQDFVDFVVYRPSDDAVVLIELKCGFESSDSAWLAKQERAHAVQLAVTKRLFALTYPGIKNVRALVFRVHSAGVRVHGVPAEAKALVDSTLAQIQMRKSKVYKKRTFKTKEWTSENKERGPQPRPGAKTSCARGL